MILAEALSLEPVRDVSGRPLHLARALAPDSPKYIAMRALLAKAPIPYFLALSEGLFRLTGKGEQTPFVIVTDWSDPTELTGLRLETEDGEREDAELCFLAFFTDWERLESCGIAEIFAHELSHLWLSCMGFDFARSQSNRFHTSTAITDRFMAFSEGFAEHFEMVTAELTGAVPNALYDRGYDLGAWLCARDEALRYHAVKNNRFLYHTAMPEREDFNSYQHLHMAHITSSAFMPERLKNGLQAFSSEGLIASFFYRMYQSGALQASDAPNECYAGFGLERGEVSPLTNLYCKELWALSRTDLTKPTLFPDFVREYIRLFPQDKEEVLSLFAEVTNFVSVSPDAAETFGALYRVGRRGVPGDVKAAYLAAEERKRAWLEQITADPATLDAAVYESLWAEGDKTVCPVPWEPDKAERLRFDANAATQIDFFSIGGLGMEQCRRLVEKRERMGGFPCMEAFRNAVEEVKASE